MLEYLTLQYITKRIITVLFLLVPFITTGQSLPEQLHYNSDSTQLLSGGIISQGFYDESTVRTIRLDFHDTNFWQLMKNYYDTDSFVLARLTCEDQTYDSVAVQFKGQTSYRRPEKEGSEKLSFSVKLDGIIEGQDIGGYNNLNLNNAFQDYSFMREVLYGRLSRDHLPALQGNFISLNLNGEDWGIYANIQQLNGDFIREWFPGGEGIRWRADADQSDIPLKSGLERPPGGGAKWGDGTAALNYLGSREDEYQKYYTLKDSDLEDPWNYLMNVCDVLNNTSLDNLADSLSEILDIDGTLWFLAQEIMFSDDDSYIHKGRMDYYLYHDAETGRMLPLEFDGNSAMSLRNASWSPFIHEDSINYPLLNRLLAIPELRQRYIAHAKTILQTSFDPVYANGIIDQYANTIGTHIQNDPKISFDYLDHTRAVDGLRRFIRDRRSFVMQNPEFSKESPLIGEVTLQADGENGKPPSGDLNAIVTASASHPDGIKGINLYYATGIKGQFTAVAMSDDGIGTDDLASDGIFTAEIPPSAPGSYVRYYIEAVADDPAGTVSYMPAGAEYDVLIYRTGYANSMDTSLIINEFMASNDFAQMDEYGEFDDWIEIHNRSGSGIFLGDYHLSDNANNYSKWTFPADTIGAGEYLIVWADGDTAQGPLHCNFKLSASGEEILLTDSAGKIIDHVIYGPQVTDSTSGRWPDGAGGFISLAPTFGITNRLHPLHIIQEVPKKEFLVYPNPSNGIINISVTGTKPDEIRIYSLSGRQVFREIFYREMDVSFLNSGTYILKADEHSCLLIIK